MSIFIYFVLGLVRVGGVFICMGRRSSCGIWVRNIVTWFTRRREKE